MTITDTDALTERIARALYVEACEEEDGGLTWETEESVAEEIEGWERFAAAVLPIVADEVRKAKAEALREAADFWQDTATCNTPADIEPDWLRARADQIEAGDSDERR